MIFSIIIFLAGLYLGMLLSSLLVAARGSNPHAERRPTKLFMLGAEKISRVIGHNRFRRITP